MERFAFIHGSSEGQSTFIPKNASVTICNDIADKYFKGRISRQRESATKDALFVELYKSVTGDLYCIYSFVNNNCLGEKGRDGQYFALSIVCKGVYFFPEDIYRMLYAAYEQIFKTNRILGIVDGEVQYRIPQFNVQKEFLTAFLEKVETIFDNRVGNIGKQLDSGTSVADYDSWRGLKTSLDICNSNTSFNNLCKFGRLYVSEKYESLSEKNLSLEQDILKLKKEMTDLEDRIAKTAKTAVQKARDEISKLQSVIKEQDTLINSSKLQIEEYEATINTVCKQLDKYAKSSRDISDVQQIKTQYAAKDKKDILKICLLFIVLLLALANGLLSYCFFRDNSSFFKEDEKTIMKTREITLQHNAKESKSGSNSVAETLASYLNVYPNAKIDDVSEEENEIEFKIDTDGKWEFPNYINEWITLSKESNNFLKVKIASNTSYEKRTCTFMIKAGSLEKQIIITQKSKIKFNPPKDPNYEIIVTDLSGNTLNEKDTVRVGQELNVEVRHFKSDAENFGWTCTSNCTIVQGDGKNLRNIKIRITSAESSSLVFSYGLLGKDNGNYRDKFKLNIAKTIESPKTPETPVSGQEVSNP